MDNGMDMDIQPGLQADLHADFHAADSDQVGRSHVIEPHHNHLQHHSQRHRLPHPHPDYQHPDHDRIFDRGHSHAHESHPQGRAHGLALRHHHAALPRPDQHQLNLSIAEHLDINDPGVHLPASYAAANLDSVSSNAHHAFTPVNPDDFYKSYRALHLNSNPDTLPMAAASSSRPSLRSNGDGTTPKHPVVSPTRTTIRSASNPVESRPSTVNFKPGGAHPSVMDLKKRFDQNGASASSIPRAPVLLGAAARSRRDAAASTQPRNGATSYSTLRGRTNASNPESSKSSSPRSQRTKFVAEDQVSNNSQSFASRIGKPRSAVSGKPNASKSMTNLAPKSPPQPTSSPHTSSRSQGLLFGEILPEQHDALTAGYGIEGSPPRRTSESSISNPWIHQRSLSDPDVEPSSPSSWYRSLNGDGVEGQTHQEPAQKGHARSQSDVPKSHSGQSGIRKQAVRKSTTNSGSSKLPLSVRQLSSPTPSQSSTRSNSPSTVKRPYSNGRTSRAGAQTTRAKTPTSRAKTPTQTPSGRKAAPRALVTPTNNTRLQANIIAPLPKLSPPLRSSRPRQPVSLASTASSRMKAVERARSPNPLSRPPSRIAEPTTRRRKISVGPIDFEKRREDIRLAYTKSIRESQALEARRQTDRQRRDMEAAESARASAAIAANATSEPTTDLVAADEPIVPPLPINPDDVGDSDTANTHTKAERVVEPPVEEPPSPAMEESSMLASDIAAALPPSALMIFTDPKPIPLALPTTQSVDSPTLGVPGSFPPISPPANTDERPCTAISVASETTEFDNETQTTPPVQAVSPLEVPVTIVKPPSPQPSSPPRARLEYQYPFQDEPDSPGFPETSQDTVQESQATAPPPPNTKELVIPGAFTDDLVADHEVHHASRPEIRHQEVNHQEVRPHQAEAVHAEEVGHEKVHPAEDTHHETQHQTLPPFEATITILPPQDDVRPENKSEDMVPFPRMEPNYESDCQSVSDHPGFSGQHIHPYDDDAMTDACTEETDDRNRTEECRSESHFDDQISYRASTCESSDVGTIDDLDYPSYDHHHPESAMNLSVPSRSGVDRTSQQSTWTDFPIDSPEVSDAGRSPALPDFDEDGPASHGHVTIFETRSIHRESRPASRLQETYPPSQSETRPSMDSARSSYLSHRLPELDTGSGFSIPYLSQRASRSFSSHVPSPNHEPPPVPTPISGSACNSQRTSGVFYEPSQNGSTFVGSERGSEDFMHMMTTPQSIDTPSLAAQDQYYTNATAADSDPKLDSQAKSGPTGKERHRLQQRRNIIKEMVDTEAVFVRDMNIVEEIYKGTAEACPKLDDKIVKLIFRNTDEIIEFHTFFLAQIKDAVSSVYALQSRRSALSREGSFMVEPGQVNGSDIDDSKDRLTSIGTVFKDNMEKMKLAHEGFLRNSDHAAKSLIQIQQDPTVKVWLNECNEVAKDLTAAWDLDSLLIKPMQRITKYPNLIISLLAHTPKDHPDRQALVDAKGILETAIIEINKTKKNFELVGQIVGRKRKESDVKAGFARAFGKRVDKLQASGNRPSEDAEYAKLNEKFGDDYLRLQVVLRDVEFYTRQVSAYVHEFLQYLSSIELVMRFQPGSYPELEAKWVQFNISIRDLEKVALEEHLSQVRKHVIEPFELVIKAYGNPSLAMKKRQKRRVDYERYEQLKRGGKNPDAKLNELVEQYDALNDTLKKELPKLSALTEKIGNICLGNFVNIQASWYAIWKDKMKALLGDCPDIPDLKEIVTTFHRDHPYAQEQFANIGILNPTYKGRMSQSTTRSTDESSSLKVRSRPSESDSRGRGLSINGDQAPMIPVPDFKRHSGSFAMSPASAGPGPMPSPHHYYSRDFYAGIGSQQPGGVSPLSPDVPGSTRSMAASTRPSTGRSFDSGGFPRQSTESAPQPQVRDSNTTYGSNTPAQESRRFSGIFHSALPLPDGPEESQRSSRASSRERAPAADGYNVLWLAASLFEFNIVATKHEAGYPYLTYQAGEIFDVIAEKGELWLAKNQDDPVDQVGWIWSKHFAKLADS
ncbi:hypothetical protein EDB81DRAFT_191481 [Dactylonectria macrodidyma]|uniref:DH domain-containing protein n=1 Tax=Dactylonectria macrodidyma TaxID=307937 RepID=A0A9P9JLP7_9HYPO|nr:hypothetical protein EDB81DRAFT_191481 [Dactylonectria macrodidyma]